MFGVCMGKPTLWKAAWPVSLLTAELYNILLEHLIRTSGHCFWQQICASQSPLTLPKHAFDRCPWHWQHHAAAMQNVRKQILDLICISSKPTHPVELSQITDLLSMWDGAMSPTASLSSLGKCSDSRSSSAPIRIFSAPPAHLPASLSPSISCISSPPPPQ